MHIPAENFQILAVLPNGLYIIATDFETVAQI